MILTFRRTKEAGAAAVTATPFLRPPPHPLIRGAVTSHYSRAVTSGKGDTAVVIVTSEMGRAVTFTGKRAIYLGRLHLPPPYFQPLQYASQESNIKK